MVGVVVVRRLAGMLVGERRRLVAGRFEYMFDGWLVGGEPVVS